jgi:hypothetical protein
MAARCGTDVGGDMSASKVHARVGSLVALSAALTVAGCGQDADAPAVPAPTATSGPTPLPAVLPTDCAQLGTETTRQETVGDLTLQSNGEGFVRPAPTGATLALGCDWITGDTTGLLLLVSRAEPTAVADALQDLTAEGYTCQPSEDFGTQFCRSPGSGPDTEELVVARDDVWIYASTSNRNARALLSEIVQDIFG